MEGEEYLDNHIPVEIILESFKLHMKYRREALE